MKEKILQHVKYITDSLGTRNLYNKENYINLNLTKEYIIKQFRLISDTVNVYDYEVDGKIVSNIELVLEGAFNQNDILILGAHYDTVNGTVGANDNASGIAALILLAEDLVKCKLNNTVKLVAFVLEEPPYFMTTDMGSYQYHKLCKGRKDNIIGMICLDIIGCYTGEQEYPLDSMVGTYPKEGNFIAAVGEPSSFMDNFLKIYKSQDLFPIESFVDNGESGLEFCNWSDHYWFYEYGAFLLTDTAFFRHETYHSSDDTYDKLDYEKMEEMLKVLVVTIKEMVGIGK